ncbi:hypothetical protein M3A49_22535 [Paraburkholderia sp. CNPSo 3076]|uniref:hypothetical protein n=1 Tax=Paraburkholderia sp. CNPSo 3076 TaxID=2940936 RepID=UPI0022592574|nr:hypothetical protein [Paraburkholderia sp. CNPSo 3076]MCX5542240.1 hypothetical protein [Paraburkholderia sp. CNPSo 3076]
MRAAGKSVWALVDEKIVHHGASSISGTYLQAQVKVHAETRTEKQKPLQRLSNAGVF